MSVAKVILLLVLVCVARACIPEDNEKENGQACTCSDKCLGGTECLHDVNGGTSCQCLPCYTFDEDEKKCVDKVPDVPVECVNLVRGDIYFLLDSSNSISDRSWAKELKFVSNVAKSFKIGPNDVQVALGTFSTNFNHEADLNKYQNQEEFSKALLATKQLKQMTNTYKALDEIRTNGYLTSAERGARPGVRKIIFLVTDGQSQNVAKTIAAAEAVRQQNIVIYAIGVATKQNKIELQGIAGNEKNVYQADTFDGLEVVRDQITQHVCNGTTEPDPVVCAAQIRTDLVFVIDSAANDTSPIFNNSLEFVASLIRRFSIGENSQRVALMADGTVPKSLFPLTSSKDLIYTTLVSARAVRGTYNTHTALLSAFNHLKPENGGRQGVNKTIVLLTDGKSIDRKLTDEAVAYIKNQRVNVFTVGVTSKVDNIELTSIASRLDYRFQIDDFSSLVDHANLISQRVCDGNNPDPVIPCPPATKVDIAFLVDSSGSIGPNRFRYNADFILRVLAGYYVSPKGTEVGFATYGTHVRNKLSFSGDRNAVEQFVNNVTYQGSTTNTHKALLEAYNGTFKAANSRPDAKRVVVVITDGLSTEPELTREAAALLKSTPVTVLAVGVGRDTDRNELLTIASDPAYVFTVGDYNVLDNFASPVAEAACNDDPKKHNK